MVFEHLRAPVKAFDPEGSLGQPIFDSYEPLVNAMMVCHKWYVVASEKASLWTDVTVEYSRGRAGPTCLLERSWMAPIHLRLTIGGSAEDSAYLSEVVRTHASRLRQLDVCMTNFDTINTAGQLLENDMPLLQCLKMSDEYYQQFTVMKTASSHFPSLRGMMLMGHLWLPAPETGPLARLTHLYVSMLSNDMPLASITTLLDAAPALEVLELHECSEVTLTERPTGTTTLKHLTHLTIRRMSTRIAEVFMPALVLPRATAVCLCFDVDTEPTTALLPQPEWWRDATRIRIEGDPYHSLIIEFEGDTHDHRVALCLEYYRTDGEWAGQHLWPLPVPTLGLPKLPNISAAYLSIFRNWKVALRQLAERVPALATLVLEPHMGDEATTSGMVDGLRDLLLQSESQCTGLKEIALLLPRIVNELTDRLAPVLEKRKRDGRQIERFRTWIDNRPTDNIGDVGDALAEYVGSGEIEHEKAPFWSRDEELWRRENEFWEVPRTWW